MKENIVNSGALANVAEGCDLAIGKALGTDQYVLAIRNTLARDVRWVLYAKTRIAHHIDALALKTEKTLHAAPNAKKATVA